VPYGVYDVTANAGWMNVGTDHDTAAFAVESIRRWWNATGCGDYPTARRLLITILHQRLALPQVAIAALFSVRPETIRKRIRDIRQLLDQAGHVIHPGPRRLASLDDLTSFSSAQGITTPPQIKTAC